MKNFRLNKRTSRGFNLLELLAVVVIIAALAAVVISQLGGGSAVSKAESEKSVLINVYQGMTELTNGGTYGPAGTDLMPALIARKKVARAWAVTDTTATNIFSGAVTAVSVGSTALLTTNNETPEACIAIVHAAANFGTATVGANGTALGTGTISDADATNACNKPGQGNVVTLQTTS